jgi:aspartate/methionine/tyrosine aminotransferase
MTRKIKFSNQREYRKARKNRLCANTPAQYAAVDAFKRPRNYTESMVAKLKERRVYSYKKNAGN